MGDVSAPSSHPLIASASYVNPSSAMWGSLITSCSPCIRQRWMKCDGGVASEGDANWDDPVVRQAAFISWSTTTHTSPASSGWRPQLKLMHLSPRCAILFACVNGQSPAEASMIECRVTLKIVGWQVRLSVEVADPQVSQLADEVGINENIPQI